MSEAKNTEVKAAQTGAAADSPQGGENSQANTEPTPATAAQEGANPPAAATATQPAADNAKATKAKKAKSGKFIVVSPFADKDNFSKMWNEGDDVSHFNETRLADCIKRGLIKEA